MIFFRKYKIEVIVFACALTLRVLLFSFNLHSNNGDFVKTIKGDDGYYEVSQNILHGNGFSADNHAPYTPYSLRPPFWHYVIALTASATPIGYGLTLIFELIVASLIPVVGMKIALQLMYSEKEKWQNLWVTKIPTIIGILMALEPYSIFLSFVLYNETFFTFLFLLGVWFFFKFLDNGKRTTIALSGLFFGLGALVKPTLQFMPLFVILFSLFAYRGSYSKKLFAPIFLIMIIFALVIAPWVIRNKYDFGRYDLSSQMPYNLYIYMIPTVLSIDNHTSFGIELSKLLEKSHVDESEITIASAPYFESQAFEVIREHPVALIKSLMITFITFFTHDGLLTVFQYAGITVDHITGVSSLSGIVQNPGGWLSNLYKSINVEIIAIILLRCLWYVNTVLFFIGIYYLFKNKLMTSKMLFALGMILYFALTTSINGLGVNARFRVPVLALIFFFSVFGACFLVNKFKRGEV